MEYYRINYDEQRFIHDKQYREERIKYVDDKNYLKMYNSKKHRKRGEAKEFQDEDKIQAVLDAQNVEEQEEDDSNDDNKNVNDNVNTDRVMTKTEMMKYLMIIDYYKLPYSVDDFIYNKKYRKESIKQGGLDQYLKTFDKENIGRLESSKLEEYGEKCQV
jgi:hypothetical protein